MLTLKEQNGRTMFVSDLQVGMVYQDFLLSRKRFWQKAIGPLDLTWELRVAIRSFIFAFGLTQAREMAALAYQTSKKPEQLDTKPQAFFERAWPTKGEKVAKAAKLPPKKKRRKKRHLKLAGKIPAKLLKELHNGT